MTGGRTVARLLLPVGPVQAMDLAPHEGDAWACSPGTARNSPAPPQTAEGKAWVRACELRPGPSLLVFGKVRRAHLASQALTRHGAGGAGGTTG